MKFPEISVLNRLKRSGGQPGLLVFGLKVNFLASVLIQ